MSSIPRDHNKVPVRANLGALFGWTGISVPTFNTPLTTLHYTLQPFEMVTRQTYPPTYIRHQPNEVSPPLPSSSEDTPSSTSSDQGRLATPQVATIQLPDGNGYFFPAPFLEHGAIPMAGPSRVPTRRQRPTPYSRAAVSNNRPMTSGCSISRLAAIRLSLTGICKIPGCGENLSSGDAFMQHLKDRHSVSTGKNGSNKMLCPWEGCGKDQTKASLFNHILAHNVKHGCGVCDDVIAPRSDCIQKHFRTRHLETHGLVSIHANTRSQYAYLFFHEGVPSMDFLHEDGDRPLRLQS